MVTKKYIRNHSLIYLILILLCTSSFSCIRGNKNDTVKKFDKTTVTDSILQVRKTIQLESLKKHIGEKFALESYVDTSGKTIPLDFKKSKVTIIDFWMKNCPPCNAEMIEFNALLKNRDSDIRVYSISINQFKVWKNLFIDRSERYSFLQINLSNWVHLVLKSNTDPLLGHEIAEDRISELITNLDVTFYPSFFVVNKDGIIIARPESAVEYLKQKL